MVIKIKRDLDAAITKIVAELGATQNPEQLTSLIKKGLDPLLPSDRLGVLFWDPVRHRMTHEAHAGFDVASDNLPFGSGYPQAIHNMVSTAGIETDLEKFPGERIGGYVESGLQTMAHVPIVSKGGLSGAIALFSSKPNAYSEADLALLLKLSEAVSPFLENTALVLQLRNEISVRNAMSELISRVITASNTEEIYEEFQRSLSELLNFQRFTILRIRSGRSKLHMLPGRTVVRKITGKILENAFVRGTRVKGLSQGKRTVLTEEGEKHLLKPHIEKEIRVPDRVYKGKPNTVFLEAAGLNVHNL